MRIGVVIPARDEEPMIGGTLRAVREGGRAAIVVVADCGSTDRTVAVARAEGALVTGGRKLRCRAAALGAGAALARRERPDLDVVFFVHADSRPPRGWDHAIARALSDPRAAGGAFDFTWEIDPGVGWYARTGLLLIRTGNRIRMRLTRAFYGDQGIFVRAAALDAIGGVPEVSLLEDLVLCRRLRRHGALRVARGRMTTSPRRFLRHGIVRQVLIDGVILSAERLGLRPARLHAWYNREKT